MLQCCLSIVRCLNFHGTVVKISYQQNTPLSFLLFFPCRKTHLCRRRSGPDGDIHIFNSYPAELCFEICCGSQGHWHFPISHYSGKYAPTLWGLFSSTLAKRRQLPAPKLMKALVEWQSFPNLLRLKHSDHLLDTLWREMCLEKKIVWCFYNHHSQL